MVKLKTGDKVMLTNVDNILFGDKYWKENDIAEVVRVSSLGGVEVTTKRGGSFYIMRSELPYLIKMLPANAKREENKDA